ncbi:MAG: hypothetical protein KDD11_05475 [Acidobacteria bacterium]|nr:hypothetical protein [Acidobacteriota bacterium]
MKRSERRLALVGYDFQTERLERAVAPRLAFGRVHRFDLREAAFEADLRRFDPQLIVQYGSETTDPPRDELNRRYRLAPALAPTVYAENAWLPQGAYLYLDEAGLADQSSVAQLSPAELPRPERRHLTDTLAAYRRRVLPAAPAPRREGFLLLCLQVPDDTVILRASPFHDMQRLIDRIEEAFAGLTVVVRPHPLDPREYRTRRAALRRDGGVAEWIRRARTVLACNSTTLVEALALGVPAAALGKGLFSGKGVCWEWDGEASSLASAVDFRADPDLVDGFLWELARRQIPLDDDLPDHGAFNPVLRRLAELWP